MSNIKFYNTLTRKTEVFKPINQGHVLLYTCGPTVYNSLHIGNWLAYIRWDILVRTLQINGYEVKRVLNITDVGHLVGDGDEGEDKLEAGAKREDTTAWQVAKRYTVDFLKSMDELNLLPPTVYAKATDYIDQQIDLIKTLESKNVVYKIDDGMYFDTSKFARYSDFAKLNLAEQAGTERVEANPQKRQASDFALWKFSPTGKKRDMEWDSPWGKGFPGWHIECSAIALNLLGETIDIHTGGIDHIPVHHTNEIAQSETATGKAFANFWLHNNFLLISDAKISKSLENGLTLDDLAQKGYSTLDFKMMVLQSHYRTEASFSWDVLESAKVRLKQLKGLTVLKFQSNPAASLVDDNYFKNKQAEISVQMNDDMNTPSVLAILSKTIDEVTVDNRGLNPAQADAFSQFITFLDLTLGLNLNKLVDISVEQKKLLDDRARARQNNDWAEADKIRDKLLKQNIELKDGPHAQIWNWI